jgi:hypothetical protein
MGVLLVVRRLQVDRLVLVYDECDFFSFCIEVGLGKTLCFFLWVVWAVVGRFSFSLVFFVFRLELGLMDFFTLTSRFELVNIIILSWMLDAY